MKYQSHPFSRRKSKVKGQVIVIYGLLLPIIFLFMGLGLDTGLMYITKARLSRSVDAVALRLARKFTEDVAARKKMAASIMKANYPAFMDAEPLLQVTSGSNMASAGGEIMTATSADQKLKIITKAVNGSGDIPMADDPSIIQVSVTAEVDHQTFFMPLAGINTVHMTEVASAQRFPALNIMVLDVSGSMRNGADANLIAGVKAFVDEFVDDRDYFLVVTFSTMGKVVWPDKLSSDGYFKASRGFKGTDSTLRPNATDKLTDPDATAVKSPTTGSGILEKRVRFAGVTSASEGMRVAFENADLFLKEFSPEQRVLIKVNYVFFTDGAFNSFRGYVRGVGYGMSKASSPTADSLSSFAVDTGRPAGEVLPSFHSQKPINASTADPYNGAFVNGTGSDISLTNYSGSTGSTYNLTTRMSAFNPATQPGVNAVIQGYEERAANWDPPYTTNPPSGTGSPTIRSGNAGSTWYPSSSNWGGLFWDWDTATSTWKTVSLPTTVQIAQEAFKMERDHGIYFPVSDPGSFQDVTKAYWEYYPGGRMFSNIEPPADILKNNESFYLENASASWGPESGTNNNYGGWNYGVTRLSKYYPRYSIGRAYNDFNYPNVTTNNSSGKAYVAEANANWYRVGPPLQFYSFRDGVWVDCKYDTETRITEEGNWLAEAQCMVARVQHTATIYSILLGSSGNVECVRRMANDTGSAAYYSDQIRGKYYATTDSSTLPAIFREIAQKISVRISE